MFSSVNYDKQIHYALLYLAVAINGSQLAKMEKSIPHMSLP